MRKNVFGKQLSRDANERKALFKTLASSLIMSERITTTEAKAKALRPYVEKLITKVKVRGQEARQFVEPNLSKEAVEKLLSDTAGRFSDRSGGYTRIIKLGNRFADNAPIALIEWVDKTAKPKSLKPVKKIKVPSKKPTAKVASLKKSVTKKSKKEKKNE